MNRLIQDRNVSEQRNTCKILSVNCEITECSFLPAYRIWFLVHSIRFLILFHFLFRAPRLLLLLIVNWLCREQVIMIIQLKTIVLFNWWALLILGISVHLLRDYFTFTFFFHEHYMPPSRLQHFLFLKANFFSFLFNLSF